MPANPVCPAAPRNVTKYVDAFAIGPYFGSWTSADTDLDTFVAKLPAQVNSSVPVEPPD